jgi:hypothetical protein
VRRSEDFDLLWEKGDAINRYTFNGKQYDKPGQGMPDFLMQAGMAPVKIGDGWETLQVADQFFPIFLLDQTGPAAAEAISDVARLDKISAAMKMADRDKREAISTRKVRGQDVAVLEMKLSAYQGLDLAASAVSGVEAKLSSVDTCIGRLEALVGYVEATKSLTVDLQSLLSVVNFKVPSFQGVQFAWGCLQKVVGYQSRLSSVGGDFKRLVGVGKLGDPPDIAPVVESLRQVKRLAGWVGRLRTFRGAFERLDVASKAVVPVIDTLVDARDKAKSIARLQTRYAAMQVSIQKLEREVDVVVAEEAAVQAQLDELGVCPTCSQPVRHVYV